MRPRETGCRHDQARWCPLGRPPARARQPRRPRQLVPADGQLAVKGQQARRPPGRGEPAEVTLVICAWPAMVAGADAPVHAPAPVRGAATALYEHLTGPVAANPYRLGKALDVPFEDVLSTRRAVITVLSAPSVTGRGSSQSWRSRTGATPTGHDRAHPSGLCWNAAEPHQFWPAVWVCLLGSCPRRRTRPPPGGCCSL
jgi:hypothetical protein